nr:MAG TPA: hypothetical protein [Caudoviricetes sp.]
MYHVILHKRLDFRGFLACFRTFWKVLFEGIRTALKKDYASCTKNL